MKGFISRMWNGGKTVPVEVPTDDRQVLEGVETWGVNWMGRNSPLASGQFSTGQLFTNEPAAREFEKALRNAFELVKDSDTPKTIRVGKQ